MSGSIKINYYDQFHCIADQCPFSCCQEWKIGVDNHTYLKWENKKLSGETGSLCHHVKGRTSDHTIILNKEKKCPFLNGNKLCKLVLEFGDDYLSETCTTFPRQINTFEDRTEYTLNSGCPVVVDMMRDYTDPITLIKDEMEGRPEDRLFSVREMMLDIIQNKEYTLPERLMMIFYNLLELFEQKELILEQIAKCCTEKYLKPVADAIKKMSFYKMDTIYESNELFLDVVENYRKQGLYTAYLEKTAVFAEQLEENYSEDEIVEAYKQFIPLFKGYENLLEKYMVSEIFGSGLTEEMNFGDMLIAFEWLSIEYAVIRQAVFLRWLMQDKAERNELSYTIVKDYVMIISRVTGYDQSDVREYLENSFEEIIWEWGYQALVIGHDSM